MSSTAADRDTNGGGSGGGGSGGDGGGGDISPTETKQQDLTLSQHINDCFADTFLVENGNIDLGGKSSSSLSSSSSSTAASRRMDALSSRLPPIHQHGVDAFWSLGGISRIQLPNVMDWNSRMRKAYTFLFWIRPRIDHSQNRVAVVTSNLQGCLYKFAHDQDPTGIIVYSNSEWVQLDEHRIQTTLTALCGVTVLTMPLTLKLDEWSLVGCTHVFPYLKRPQMKLVVNGETMGVGELEYPNNLHFANDNVVLQNMTCGGVHTYSNDEGGNDNTIGGNQEDKTKQPSEKQPLLLDVSSFALYPVAITPTIQSILYEAGPTAVINGRVVPLIPPVANWNKGSSIEAGPKVGIPLIVHGSAPEVQQLSTTAVLCFDAVHSIHLDSGGGSSGSSTASSSGTRFLCPMIPQSGYGEKSPRVGLMLPGPPVRYDDHGDGGTDTGPPQCYITGNVTFCHALLDYCFEKGISVRNSNSSPSQGRGFQDEYNTTLYWTVAMEDAIHYTVLPFFLSLCPPGKFVEHQESLYVYSISQLYALYSNDGVLAATCIDCLSSWIETGGPRIAESVLQNGYIHILAECLCLSLIRAQKAKFFVDPPKSNLEWYQRFTRMIDESTVMPNGGASGSATSSTSVSLTSPRYIPPRIIDSCARLVATCCGPAMTSIDAQRSTIKKLEHMTSSSKGIDPSTSPSTDLPMWVVIRRTSDLALTAIFALAFDVDLWNADAKAAGAIYQVVADRYSDCGYILRSQISVQYFLDCIVKRQARYDEVVGQHLTRILTTILIASLSNKRSISQGEHDVAACVGTLSESPLSSLGAHVVLNSITRILEWCDILPNISLISPITKNVDEQAKMQIASRLGRNLLISNFHDVIAPMILSRTVFSGEATAAQMQQQHRQRQRAGTEEVVDPTASGLSWESHWQLSLLLFSWVSSIAGPEGLIAAKSSGNLLLASALAGSLTGAMNDAPKEMVLTLYIPPPGMALMIGSTLRSEWSYTDLIADRLQIMVPLLPGLVVSLISPSFSTRPSHQVLTVLARMLTSVGSAFHKVYGGTLYVTTGQKSNLKNFAGGSSESVKAARTFAPDLIKVALILEECLMVQSKDQNVLEKDEFVVVSKPEVAQSKLKNIDLDSWVDVPASSNESVISELAVTLPSDSLSDDNIHYGLEVVNVLRSCQKNALNTLAGLLSSAMNVGGSGAAIPLLNTVLSSFEESILYIKDKSKNSKGISVSDPPSVADDASSKTQTRVKVASARTVALNVLCRLCAHTLIKSLKRQEQWEIWSYELSSAVSKLCQFVEEKQLLKTSLGENMRLSDDQVVLVAALLEILSYGRDATGWCQLALPAMSSSFTEGRGGKLSADLSAASKLLLPVLQTSLRSTLLATYFISSSIKIKYQDEVDSLLRLTLKELDLTLTAAIVGLSFSGARDIALCAMATFRKAAMHHQGSGDAEAASGYASLIKKVAEELRVRYEGERRLRENALFDAYDVDKKDATKDAMEGANAIEELISGGILGSGSPSTEEITFEQKSPQRRVSDDFVLFHEPSNFSTQPESKTRLGYADYIGLGAALEECRVLSGTAENDDAGAKEVVVALATYLDCWDSASQNESNESEVLSLFSPSSLTETTAALDDNDRDGAGPMSVAGSETAADAMSAFFEFAAGEKSRMKELNQRFLPSHRQSRFSYSERFCWARFMEVTSMDVDKIWERGMPDGNRDVRSRLPTLPCCPQFRRYIPKYLDHYAEPDICEEGAGEDGAKVTRKSAIPQELDDFTKTLLQFGDLEIVDITKKELVEEDEPDISIQRTVSIDADDDEAYGLSDVGNSQMSGSDNTDQNEGKKQNNEQPKVEDVHSEDFAEAPSSAFINDMAGKGHTITTSAFSTPPDNASSSLSLLHSAAAGMIEMHMDNCLQVKAEGSRPCTMLLTATHLVLEYEGEPEGYFEGEVLALKEDADRQRMIKEDGEYKENSPEEAYQQKSEKRQREIAGSRPKSIRWNLSEVSHVYLRRYRLRDSAIEVFFIPTGGAAFGGYGLYAPSTSLFLDLGPGYEGHQRRDDAAFAIMHRVPQQAIKQWPDRSAQFLHDQLNRLALGWVEGKITNFDYLLHLNMLAGRSYNDVCQYPVFPWVLSDFTCSEVPDLTKKESFRDLTKPVGALNPDRLEEFIERFDTFADPSIPPFMYGSHYSTSAGVVLHFLVRLHPFAGLHRQLQSGHFDVADRLFSSVPRTWSMCTGTSAAEVKELTPEWYCNPAFLKNTNTFKLGTSQDGEVLGDVELPPWAQGSAEKFIEVQRAALESELCSEMLPDWIDLIFGKKQQGPEAIKAHNVFFYLTYYGSVDVASIKDESLRQATELQIAHFGQCPMQLFRRPHVRRIPQAYHKMTFFQLLSAHSQKMVSDDERAKLSLSNTRAIFGEPMFLPFLSAPLSHWVHLNAPPPGPHAALIAVRFAGTDRCLAIDAKGIIHTFRWAWRPEEDNQDSSEPRNFDKGCFVAQRELPRFRSVPRLMYSQHSGDLSAVAISKTVFAGRTILLVLSDGDGCGGLGMQLVDPSKGQIRGEVLVPAVHGGKITCIATDPIGTAAGHGGVGGELVLFGSSDGTASLWRFMSSYYIPLRPRVRLGGQRGRRIVAVALCSATYIAVTVSSEKCCLHSIGNGSVIRILKPPQNTFDLQKEEAVVVNTKFADCPAVAVSVQGFVVTVCESVMQSEAGKIRKVTTLHLFNTEGVSLGSKPLESWRGLPNKMYCTPDGTAVMLCCGRGVTIHRLSAWMPLEIIDEWQIIESGCPGNDGVMEAAFDVDLGTSLTRPVVASAGCSNGVLRLHALPGISSWSERHKSSGFSQTVGSALAKPAQRLNQAVKEGLGLGRHLAGMGREIGREVSSDVKERGIGGFLGFGGLMTRKPSNG